MRTTPLLLSLVVLAACGSRDRPAGAPCGIAALAAPVTLLSQFSVPKQTLAKPPAHLPEQLPVRFVAGPTVSGIVGRNPKDSTLIIGVEGQAPATIKPQYGVLVADTTDTARGVLVYESVPVEGAPQLGVVAIGSSSIPLLGIELNLAKVDAPGCPLFPDSAAAR